MEPEEIEEAALRSNLIQQIVVIGQVNIVIHFQIGYLSRLFPLNQTLNSRANGVCI